MVEVRRSARLVLEVPFLDADQQAVLALDPARAPVVRVLGGPGTGKTTLAVELVADRVARLGLSADGCLVLAPTRLAATALREQVTERVGATTTQTLARTHQALGFAILREHAALRGEPAPRLLSGPEQDVVLRELLAGHAADPAGGPSWPPAVSAALSTRGFRAELRDLLMRAAEHGVEAGQLAELGRRHRRPEWVAAAQVLDEYDQVTALAQPGAFDPAWVLTAAADLLEDDPTALARLRDRLSLVVVDDAHELTWPAARLLATIAHPGLQVVLLGDPDSAVQTFRGADPGLLWWDRWRALGGAPTIVLRAAYRMGATVHEVASAVACRIGALGGGSQRAARPMRDGGAVRVAVLRTASQEAELVATTLRRARLQDDIPWREMAVIVRGSARASTLRRVLAAAGVPLTAPTGELPVRDEVAVRPLLALLDLVLRWAVDPEARLGPTEAADLLLSPLGGSDAVTLRRLRRALRRDELDSGGRRTSDELLAAALGDPMLSDRDEPEAEPLRRITRAIVAGVRAAARDSAGWAPGVSAEAVLWAVWEALDLAGSWRRDALRGGLRGARADRDLDAVVALFDAAARFADRLPGAGPDAFLEHVRGEEVAGDTLALRAPSHDAVAVLTPAAADGRQWRLACVAGVQEGAWPDLRLRGSLLGSEALVDAVTGRERTRRAAQTAVRHDETRLLHVAVSRASERLLVSAVRNDDAQPSPYLDVIDPLPDDVLTRPLTDVELPLTMPALVGALRRSAAADDRVERTRAARLLARLADEQVPGADPARWWGLGGAADDRPRRAPDQTVRVSPSKLEQFHRCSLQWLLLASGGSGPKSASASIGTLVHDVVAECGDVDAATLQAEIDRRWPQLGLPDGWVGERKRREAHAMAQRVVDYVATATGQGWELAGAEVSLTAEVGRAVVSGTVDRLERHTGSGQLRVLDYKTGATKPSATELQAHPQLAAYQVAVTEGAFADLGTDSAGAALLQLGKAAPKSRVGLQPQPPLQDYDDPAWAHRLVQETAEGMAGGRFVAAPGQHCTVCAVRTSCPAQPEGGVL